MKYIVYCTVNQKNNKIYIGVHRTQDPSIFDYYIGNGVYVNNSSTYSHPKTKFQHAVKKYGPKAFKRYIIKTYDHEEDAYMLEAEIVNKDFLTRPDVYNMVVGGVVGRSSTSIKIYSYNTDGSFAAEYESINFAAKMNSVHMRSIWRAEKEKIKCAGYYWSKTKYDVLDLKYYKTYEISRGTALYQYDSSGMYECSYDSINVASRILNVNPSNLSKSMYLGIKCGGKYFLDEYAPEFHRAKTERIKNTKVYQYSYSGEFIAEWSSALEAQKSLNIKSDLHKIIKLGATAGGYQWSHVQLDHMPKLQPKTGRVRRIGKYNTNDELIQIYESLSTCKKENGGGVTHVLSGRDKTHKGFVYKYLS